jgi:hypothetical protein
MQTFTSFCRELCVSNKPRVLKCQFLPKHLATVNLGWHYPEYIEPFTTSDIEDIIKPLLLLRNCIVSLENIPEDDYLCHAPTPHSPTPLVPYTFPLGVEHKLLPVVAGVFLAPRVFEIFGKLLQYAQTYENCDEFRHEMEPRWGEARRLFLRGFHDRNSNWKSPYKRDPMHNVELALQQASLASEDNNMGDFQAAQKDLLKYLEPQYHRIANTSFMLNEFIKEHKRLGGFFSMTDSWGAPSIRFSKRDLAQVVVLLT